MTEKDTILLKIEDKVDVQKLLGSLDDNIKRIENATSTTINIRDDCMRISGEKSALAEKIVKEFITLVSQGEELDIQKINYVIDMAENAINQELDCEVDNRNKVICYTHLGRPLRPKTKGQSEYISKIKENEMVFGIGPAGTGKTYLACALAIDALKNKDVQRIILARPAVEAGESLGFLPGDLKEKVDPYLRPLHDALNEIMGLLAAAKLEEKGTIEIVPLAYMRGRTLDNAFIILDEAQNTTREQMKMFLTRMGFNSKVVVTGDITQIDLPKGKASGLVEACKVLTGVPGIEFSYLSDVDVVRHELVKRIIKAYREYEMR